MPYVRSLNIPQPAVIILLMLLGFSCKKETQPVDAGTKMANPTDYLLVSQTWAGPTTNGESYILSYNDQNLLSDAEHIQWGGGSTANGDTSYYHFEYLNGLCQKWTITQKGNPSATFYTYNDKGLPVKVVYYDGDRYNRTDRYEYDAADRLASVTDSGWQLEYAYEFLYDNHGNPAVIDRRSLTDSIEMRDELTSYDDKVNWVRAVNGLPSGSIFHADINSFNSGMLHNVLTSTFSFSGFPANPPGSTQYQYQYQYNEQGLPTQMISGPWIVTNVYKKYK